MLLRKQIEAITLSQPCIAQEHYLEKLKQYNKHNIEAAANPWPQLQYTSLMHVFGLVDSRVYRRIASRYDDVYAGPEFVQYLSSNKVLIPCSESTAEAIVLYSQSQVNKLECSHAGIQQDDGRVLSKWGSGDLWLHGTFDIPASYGKYASFYSPLDPGLALNWFLKFARCLGADNSRPRFNIQS